MAIAAEILERWGRLDVGEAADFPKMPVFVAVALNGRVLLSLAARDFLVERTATGRPLDPVARFHLGNGARLERLNFLGDRSPKALAQAHGLMVNYLYKLEDIEANHEALAQRGEVTAAPAVTALLGREKDMRRSLPAMPAIAARAAN